MTNRKGAPLNLYLAPALVHEARQAAAQRGESLSNWVEGAMRAKLREKARKLAAQAVEKTDEARVINEAQEVAS